MNRLHGMTSGKVPIRIPLLNQCAGLMRPFISSVSLQVISKVPSDIRKGTESCDGITQEAPLILAGRRRMNFVIVHIKNHRDDHIPISRIAQHALKLLP